MQKYSVIFYFFIIITPYLYGQNDTILLRSVTVKASKDFDIQYIDSLSLTSLRYYDNRNILNTLSGISLKNYGIGGLSSLSMYALPSRYSDVRINDIPLTSAMSGSIDASIIPLDFVNIVYTNQEGNLPTSIDFFSSIQNNTTVEGTYSNAKNTKISTCIPLHIKNNQIYLFVNNVNNRNEYHLLNNYVYPPKTILITGYPSHFSNVLFSDKINLSKHKTATFNWLYSNSLQNIFPTLTQEQNHSLMLNEFYGGSAKYKIEKKHISLNTTSSFSKHYLFYSDSSKNVFSHNNSYDFRIGQKTNISVSPNFSLLASALYHYEKAITNNYDFSPYRHTYSIRGKAIYHNKYLGITLNGKVLSDIKNVYPFGYGATMILKHIGFVQPSISFQHSIVLPTFNDLYWYPGGNISLKPEEINIFSFKLTFFDDNIKLLATHSQTHNEIVWKPIDNSTLWQAVNYAHAYRTVLSIIANHSFILSDKLMIKLLLSYNYIQAQDDKGKYLIYVPLNKSVAQIDFSYNKKLLFSTHYTYYGLRYTSYDNYFSLPPFSIYDLALSYKITLKKITLVPALVVNNITNTAYEYIPSMPMPLRYFSIKLKFMFNPKK